ncbi:MAG: Zn-ribbon domain-containing OB-fold protein [Actinobacteria bacterium]|nr:Zn-ribbon domain-containing OB-fold protein [Actinomycetota bacterium]
MTSRPPMPDDFSQRYWDAAREGRLLIQRCTACGRPQFYPRRHCRHCLAADPEWVEAAGGGELHAFTVVRWTPDAAFAGEVPYVFALVDLDEGVRITCNVLDADVDTLSCGQRVTVVMRDVDGWALPCVTTTERSP